MVDLSAYSSQILMKANEKELKQILLKFKEQHLPLWKFGLFVSYNAVSLTGMYIYGVKLRGQRTPPSFTNRKAFSIARLFSRGVKHSMIMISIYIAGLYIISRNTISLPLLRKLTQIQSTYHSFGLKFDPNYQEHLLFSRMRKFDISEQLIDEIKEEINKEKQSLIESGGLLPETIAKIKQTQQLYLRRQQQLA